MKAVPAIQMFNDNMIESNVEDAVFKIPRKGCAITMEYDG